MVSINRILCDIDFSDFSLDALRHALMLSLLTIPPPVREPGPPLLKTILCPLEFSDASTRALAYALSLAQEADARLILLHVIEDLSAHAGAEAVAHLSLPEHYQRLEEDSVTRLVAAVPEEARVWCRPDERVVRGRAYQEILKTVRDERVDLVVMGVQEKVPCTASCSARRRIT